VQAWRPAQDVAISGYGGLECERRIEVIPNALRLFFKRHVRRVLDAIQRAYRVSIESREKRAEFFRFRPFDSDEFEGLA